MKLNRSAQSAILKELEKIYPEETGLVELMRVHGDEEEVITNTRYLHEHGLVKGKFSIDSARKWDLITATITAKGLDFLADDGGLTAILGVVTVRLEADTVRALMTAKINDSDLPTHEKSRLIEALRDLPAESLKQLTSHIVDAGVRHAPDAIQWLYTLIGP